MYAINCTGDLNFKIHCKYVGNSNEKRINLQVPQRNEMGIAKVVDAN